MRPVDILIALRIDARSEYSAHPTQSSLGTLWIGKDTKFLHADNEKSDSDDPRVSGKRMCTSLRCRYTINSLFCNITKSI